MHFIKMHPFFMPLFLKKENILWDIRNKTVSLLE